MAFPIKRKHDSVAPQSQGKLKFIIALIFIFIGIAGCFDYTLKVGYVGLHKKVLLLHNPEEMNKLDTAQLRTYPAPSSPIIRTLPCGMSLEPLKFTNNWYQVKTPEGQIGWVYQSQVYRVPVYDAVYNLQYHSLDNHALIVTMPLIIILLSILLFANNKLTRTIIVPILLLLILINAVYIVGMERAKLHRHSHAFKRFSEYLKDKPATVYATDYLWTNRINFWTGYTRHFSYYYSNRDPHYNASSRIRTLRADTDYHSLRGVFIVVDPRYLEQAARQWTVPEFILSGNYPPNWSLVMESGGAKLFFAR